MNICLNKTSEFLSEALGELKSELGLSSICSGTQLTVVKGNEFKVASSVSEIVIHYTHTAQIFRGLKFAIKNLGAEQVFDVNLQELGVMLDCSRNAVLNLKYIKQMIRDMAVLGYNMMQLYTEDTYEIEGEEYFGHMRGRYSRQELREISAYAKMFGIELVPCVQTLAHLSTMFKWNKYASINDMEDILFVGSDETYAFLDRMMASLRASFDSKRIHIGMDEAMLIGGGKFLDKFGYKDRYEIILSHLTKVVELCKKYDFEPMMWSDMFFRTINGGNYYIEKGQDFEMLQNIIDQVPKEVTLVYWDYYGLHTEHYSRMFKEHKKFNNPISFAGGSWKWIGYAPNTKLSLATSTPAIEAMAEYNISSAMITCWGDDGAECSMSTIYAAMCAYSSYAYTSKYSNEDIDRELGTYLGFSLDDFFAMDLPNVLDRTYKENEVVCPSKYLFYNDPLIGLCDYYVKDDFNQRYLAHAETLKKVADKGGRLSYVYETLHKYCLVLSIKSELGVRIKSAYDSGDRAALKEICQSDIKTLVQYLDDFVITFRKQWEKENKLFGREVLDLRLAGMRERILVAKERIESYLSGEITEIEELIPKRLPIVYNEVESKDSVCMPLFVWTFSPGMV